MPTTTSSQADSLVLAALVLAVLLVVAVVVLVSQLAGRLRPAAPALPDVDRAPAGLGRLVPTGDQVDGEVRRGVLALESWLAAERRAAP